MSNPLAKLKQETVEFAEKILREQKEDDGKYIVDDQMENGYELPIDDGEMSFQTFYPKLAYHYPDPHPKLDHPKLTQGPIPISP